jgi:hypothetical protein
VDFNISELSQGTKGRLERIQALKKCGINTALDFCISVGWLQAERQANKAKRREKAELRKRENGSL